MVYSFPRGDFANMKKRKWILNISFIIVLLLTLIIFAVTLQETMAYNEANDDIFGSYMDPFIGFLSLLPVLVVEVLCYLLARFLLLGGWKRS